METKALENPKVKEICIQVIEPVNWMSSVKSIKKDMPTKYARQIKEWRVGNGPDDPNTYSWRAIAELFAKRYPEYSAIHNIDASNQISGMLLCDAAMSKLKEKQEDGWN